MLARPESVEHVLPRAKANSPAWTAEKLARLESLWLTTTRTATDIGIELGYTKNAIIGQARRQNFLRSRHRAVEITPELTERFAALWVAGASYEKIDKELDITKRPMLKLAAELGITRGRTRAGIRTAPRQRPMIVTDLKTLDLSFMDLQADQCRYPTTENSPYLFCGHVTPSGKSYCDTHHAICHTQWVPQTFRPYRRRVGA